MIDRRTTRQRPWYPKRDKRIIKLFKAGKTLQDVGDIVKLSRERIRQILEKNGVANSEGGRTTRKVLIREALKERRAKGRDKRIRKHYGCSAKAYDGIVNGKPFKVHRSHPAYVYYSAKRNWLIQQPGPVMSFLEWWYMWQRSGKYNQRGLRYGQYHMARRGNVGPWIAKNVHIITAEKNTSGISFELRTGRKPTHCLHGHPTGKNGYRRFKGSWRCLACIKEREKKRYDKGMS